MDIVYAKDNAFVTTPDGGRHRVTRGEHWSSDDAVVQAAPEGIFSRDPRYGLSYSGTPPKELADPPVETATAGPGERRSQVKRG